MSITFNADEIFAMAVQIERNGQAFYQQAADMQKDEATRDYFLNLVDMEKQHVSTFQNMREQFADVGESMDLYDEAGQYLATMADAYKVEGSPKITAQLTGEETMEDILRLAIGLEKDAVLFYLGMKDVVPENLGKGKVDFIIEEEKQHLVTLTAELKKLKA
ncbi:MAG: ferritin family protein [Kiritimatiellae bacterium]|nr:ferritin family protein [Kiritimatiellia bacterium]